MGEKANNKRQQKSDSNSNNKRTVSRFDNKNNALEAFSF